jgi:hypothetical protein
LRAADGTEDPFVEFESLDALPPDVVREALEPWLGEAPDIDRLDDAIRLRHGMPPRALHLETVTTVEDADVLDLGPVAERQLRIAGKTWDGADLEPEERLDGELEGSFAGTLRHVVLANVESGEPMFDVVRFHESCGVVFRAGTVQPVAFLADGIVETHDRRLRAALEETLGAARNEEPPRDDAKKRKRAPAAKPKAKAAAKAAAKPSSAVKKKSAAKKTTRAPKE